MPITVKNPFLRIIVLRSIAFLVPVFVASLTTSAKLTLDEVYKDIEFVMPRLREPVIPERTVCITEKGAIEGGFVLCTQAIQDAIDSLSEQGGGKVVIPAGTWLTGPITFRSHIQLHTEAGAYVIFSEDKNLYPLVETNFEGLPTWRCQSPINGRDLEDIAITGEGVFDGSGGVWRAVKKDKLTESQWKKTRRLGRDGAV